MSDDEEVYMSDNEEVELADKLFSSVRKNNEQKVKQLLDEGAPLNYVQGKNTVLHIAARCPAEVSGNIVKILIQRGASYSARNNDNFTPVQTAAYYGSDNLITLVRNKNDHWGNYKYNSALRLAAKNNNMEHVKALLENGADPNGSQDGGTHDCAMHHAVIYANFPMMKLLVKYGADLTLQNAKGQTPLDLAYKLHGKERVKLLLSMGAPFSHSSTSFHQLNPNNYCSIETGNAPLHLAAFHNNIEILDYLIMEQGADCSVKNKEGKTPLDLAIENNCFQVFPKLMANNAPLTGNIVEHISWGKNEVSLYAAKCMIEEYDGLILNKDARNETNRRNFTDQNIENMINSTLENYKSYLRSEIYQKLCFEVGMFFFHRHPAAYHNPSTEQEKHLQEIEDQQRYITALLFLLLSGTQNDRKSFFKTQCYLGLLGRSKKNMSVYDIHSSYILMTEAIITESQKNPVLISVIENLIKKLKPYAKENSEILNEIGELYYFLGNYQTALQYWNDSVKYVPHYGRDHLKTLEKKFLSIAGQDTAYHDIAQNFHLSVLEMEAKQNDNQHISKKATDELAELYFKRQDYEKAAEWGFYKLSAYAICSCCYRKQIQHESSVLSDYQKTLFKLPNIRKNFNKDKDTISKIILAHKEDEDFIHSALLHELIEEESSSDCPCVIYTIFQDSVLYTRLNITKALNYFLTLDIRKLNQVNINQFLLHCAEQEPHAFFRHRLFEKITLPKMQQDFSPEQNIKFYVLALQYLQTITYQFVMPQCLMPERNNLVESFILKSDYKTAAKIAIDQNTTTLSSKQIEWLKNPLFRKELSKNTLLQLIQHNDNSDIFSAALLEQIIQENSFHHQANDAALAVFKNSLLFLKLKPFRILKYFSEVLVYCFSEEEKNIFILECAKNKKMRDFFIKHKLLNNPHIEYRLQQFSPEQKAQFFKAFRDNIEFNFRSRQLSVVNHFEPYKNFIFHVKMPKYNTFKVNKIFIEKKNITDEQSSLNAALECLPDSNFYLKTMLYFIRSYQGPIDSRVFIRHFSSFHQYKLNISQLNGLYTSIDFLPHMEKSHQKQWKRAIQKYAFVTLSQVIKNENINIKDKTSVFAETKQKSLFSQNKNTFFYLIGYKKPHSQRLENKLNGQKALSFFIEKYHTICNNDKEYQDAFIENVKKRYLIGVTSSPASKNLFTFLNSSALVENKLGKLHDYMLDENKNTGELANKNRRLYNIIDAEIGKIQMGSIRMIS
jgi:ankyrin repeat protein